MAKFCTNCGASMSDDAKFCNVCGTKQEAVSPVPPPPPQYQPQQPQQQYQQPAQQQQQPAQQQQYQQPGQPQPPVRPQPQYQQPAQPAQQPPPPQYQQQPQYPPPVPPAAKPKKKGLPRFVIIAGAIVLLIVVGVVAAVTILGGAGKADYYKIGKDEIPSVKLALGEERKLTGTSASTVAGGGTVKVFEYQASGTGQSDDMLRYLTYLREKEGFLLLTGLDFSGSTGSVVVGRNSVDQGYEIQLQIEYSLTGYTISVLRQKGEITPNAGGDKSQAGGSQTPDPGSGAAGDTGSNQAAAPNSAGPTDPGGSQATDPGVSEAPNADGGQKPEPDGGTPADSGGNPAPEPGNTGAPNQGAPDKGELTKDIFSIMKSDTYHIKMKTASGGADSEIETFVKNGMTSTIMEAEGVSMRIVVRDGKNYAILYDYEAIYVADADPDDEQSYVADSDNLTYVGESSGDFNGKTYPYDEYRDKEGTQYYYFVNNGALKGIRIAAGGDMTDMEVLALDQKVPNDVFDIPDDFEIYEY